MSEDKLISFDDAAKVITDLHNRMWQEQRDRPLGYWELDAIKKRGKVTEFVFDAERYDGGWPPEGLVKAVAWWQTQLEKVPAAYRKTAKAEIGSASGYEGDHSPRIEITYVRPETDDEWAARKADVLRRKELDEQRERAEFDRLRKKLGQ